jgi:hypothetical protein
VPLLAALLLFVKKSHNKWFEPRIFISGTMIGILMHIDTNGPMGVRIYRNIWNISTVFGKRLEKESELIL